MFIFYDIEYLCLLQKLQQLQIIAEDNYEIFVPVYQLENYSGEIKLTMQRCNDKGYLTLIYDENNRFDSFLKDNISNNCPYGIGFLYQLYFCLEKNLILVIDKTNVMQLRLCEKLKVRTITIEDFTKMVIRNEQYYEFLISNKDKIII